MAKKKELAAAELERKQVERKELQQKMDTQDKRIADITAQLDQLNGQKHALFLKLKQVCAWGYLHACMVHAVHGRRPQSHACKCWQAQHEVPICTHSDPHLCIACRPLHWRSQLSATAPLWPALCWVYLPFKQHHARLLLVLLAPSCLPPHLNMWGIPPHLNPYPPHTPLQPSLGLSSRLVHSLGPSPCPLQLQRHALRRPHPASQTQAPRLLVAAHRALHPSYLPTLQTQRALLCLCLPHLLMPLQPRPWPT